MQPAIAYRVVRDFRLGPSWPKQLPNLPNQFGTGYLPLTSDSGSPSLASNTFPQAHSSTADGYNPSIRQPHTSIADRSRPCRVGFTVALNARRSAREAAKKSAHASHRDSCPPSARRAVAANLKRALSTRTRLRVLGVMASPAPIARRQGLIFAPNSTKAQWKMVAGALLCQARHIREECRPQPTTSCHQTGPER